MPVTNWAEYYGITHASDNDKSTHRSCFITFYGMLFAALLLWYGALNVA